MKTETLSKFQQEMKDRGLFRKIEVCVNLIPPPPEGIPCDLKEVYKAAAKGAILRYAQRHDDFAEALAEAAMEHLMEDVLTDDLFAPNAGFTPTAEEQANMNQAKKAAESLTSLLDGLAGLLKNNH